MTDLTIIVPYNRTSPIHIPTRDLVLAGSDSINLRVTIVESDDPSAQALVITGGANDPVCRLVVWHDPPFGAAWWDYGRPYCGRPEVLWTGTGTQADAIGSFDIAIPAGTMMQWPLRCGWSVQLDYGGDQAEMLARGSLHVRHSSLGPVVAPTVDGPAPPVGPPTVGPIVAVEFTLDLSLLDMGAMLAAGGGDIGGQPGGVGVGVFVMDDSRLDMGVKI
jgi:hypothetical protein